MSEKTVNVRILVNPSLTSFSLMGNMSGFNRHFSCALFITVRELENEIESLRKVVFSSGKARMFFTHLEHR